MLADRPWVNWEKRDGNTGLLLFRSQLRSDGMLRFRRMICKSKIRDMALSTQIEVISPHSRPVHCLALERQNNQFLLSGGLDGIVALYDLDGMSNDIIDSKRQSVKSISTSCNTVDASPQTRTLTQPQAPRVPTLSVAISSVNWYPEDSGLFATTDFDGNLNIWDTNEFTVVGNFKLRSKIYNSKFKADGSLIAVALDDHSIR